MAQESTISRKTNSTQSTSGVVNFLKELDRLQEQQLLYTKKLDKEKKRRAQLDEKTEENRQAVLLLQEKTKGGTAFKEEEFGYKRSIARLENKLQMARIKLSVAHSENVQSRNNMDNVRQNKMLFLQIKNGLEKELADLKKRMADSHREVVSVNEKKNRIKVQKSNITHQMVSDMEEFARELQAAKLNISSTQETIIGTIRERMESTYSHWENTKELKSPRGGGSATGGATSNHNSPDKNNKGNNNNTSNANGDINGVDGVTDFQYLLIATGAESADDLLQGLQQSEEHIFALYKNIQLLNEELEKVEMDNRRLESQADSQMAKLETLEGNNDKVRLELEYHISLIQKSITQQEKGYNENMQILNSISDSLMNILRNVASDEDAVDQQLLSAGVHDRNIEAYLGVVEQRIDDLIQMSKAAQHEAIEGDDFVHLAQTKVQAVPTLATPALPSLQEGFDDANDDDNDDGGARVLPININMLKEFMQKRIQKGMEREKPPPQNPPSTLPKRNAMVAG